MPRFSIKDLLIAITFVATGLIILIKSGEALDNEGVALIVIAGGLAMIGAGLLAPFQQKTVGAWIGIGLAALLFAAVSILVRVR
jgi:hypothetical protein